MTQSKNVYTFTCFEHNGAILIEAQQYPWSVLQVVPTTPQDFDRKKEQLSNRGYVAHHDTDRTFLIIHLASGDHDGKHPEHRVEVNQANHLEVAAALQDCMAQAAVWYYTNIVLRQDAPSRGFKVEDL